MLHIQLTSDFAKTTSKVFAYSFGVTSGVLIGGWVTLEVFLPLLMKVGH